MSRRLCFAAISLIGVLTLTGGGSAHAAPRKFGNCDTMNNVYPHGVGLPGAKDNVGSRKDGPVTNFKRDAALYRAQAKTLDRDNDGIACEKH